MKTSGFFFLFICVCCLGVGHAQIVTGYVRSSGADKKALSAVVVVNQQNQERALTDLNGRFQIKAKGGDPLIFTLPNFQSKTRKVPPVLGVLEWVIELNPFSVNLKEVLVRPNFNPYQIDSIQRRSTYQRTLARQKGGSLMSPFSLLAESISKRQKRIFQFQKDFVRMENERFVDSRYTPKLVKELTGLSGDTLAFFMNARPMPYDFARVATDLELKMWIRTQYKEWKEHPQYPAADLMDLTIPKTDSLLNERKD